MASLDYFPWYHSYLTRTAKLSDSELGRLVRALSKYSETGETEQLNGREELAFDFIRFDIDRARENYNAKVEKLRANGSSGSKKKTAEQMIANDSKCNQMLPDASILGQSKSKSKSKSNIYIPPTPLADEEPPKKESVDISSAATGFGNGLQAEFEKWIAYKAERNERYKPTGLKSLITEIQHKSQENGEDAVAQLIRECMANGWKGIIFDRLKATQRPQYQRREPVPMGCGELGQAELDAIQRTMIG